MIEANRAMYHEKDKVIPIIMKATEKPKDAVEYACDVLTKNCVWSVNEGFDPRAPNGRSTTTSRNGDIDAARRSRRSSSWSDNSKLAKEAVKEAGGPAEIGNGCKL